MTPVRRASRPRATDYTDSTDRLRVADAGEAGVMQRCVSPNRESATKSLSISGTLSAAYGRAASRIPNAFARATVRNRRNLRNLRPNDAHGRAANAVSNRDGLARARRRAATRGVACRGAARSPARRPARRRPERRRAPACRSARRSRTRYRPAARQSAASCRRQTRALRRRRSVARPLPSTTRTCKTARRIGGRQHVAHHQVHAVGARAGQRQIEIAVAIHIGPCHAVVGLQRADVRRRDVDELRAGVAEQRVLPAGAAGDRAVDVEVEPAVVIEVGKRARVVARVDRDAARPRRDPRTRPCRDC